MVAERNDNEAFVLADILGIGQEEAIAILQHVMEQDILNIID